MSIFKRQLGNSELSYFLPSRADGVNDMYLHIGFNAPPSAIHREDVEALWAILRVRHPLLASTIEFNDYDDVQFVYRTPQSPAEALDISKKSLTFTTSGKDELIYNYLNGPRLLGPDHLSHLVFSTSNVQHTEMLNGEPTGLMATCDIIIAATHYLGDGMALHNFANDFFSLLAAEHRQIESLEQQLEAEWEKRCAPAVKERCHMLPHPLEVRLPNSDCKLKIAAGKVDFQRNEQRIIGGHTFPKAKIPGKRETVVPTVSFNSMRTKAILKRCKEHGVSISNALFALCAVAGAEIDALKGDSAKPHLPLMMYSAMNMRPYLTPLNSHSLNEDDIPKQDHESYWFLAVGYFNIVLPAFLPLVTDDGIQSLHRTFWTRARSAKSQSTRAAKSPFVITRSFEMGQERAARSIKWAKEDDGVVEIAKPIVNGTLPSNPLPKAPSQALIGLSLLGNLDGIYKHALYSQANITLHTLTTGSRQRPGGMLLFGYTFAGRLWLSLGYDHHAYESETIDHFWKKLQDGVMEYLE